MLADGIVKPRQKVIDTVKKPEMFDKVSLPLEDKEPLLSCHEGYNMLHDSIQCIQSMLHCLKQSALQEAGLVAQRA